MFALALHDRLGYPISAFHWRDEDPGDLWAGLEHFFCIAPDRVYVDVRGATGDFQAFCMDFPSPKHFRILEDLDAVQLETVDSLMLAKSRCLRAAAFFCCFVNE